VIVHQKQLAEDIVRRLRAAGHEALLAGGCVRDLLLSRSPKDYDVATSATPREVLALFPKALTVGEAFGVVIVIEDTSEIEVATFRSDAAYTDGRHPDAVAFTDARHDALRRDFTINGMFLDTQTGRVVDYVGGQEDLKAGLIRAIGDPRQRFLEDHLRMLRAVRFASELGFTIDPGTAAAAGELAPKIAGTSGERVAAELERILIAPPAGRRRGLELADELGLLEVLLPEVRAMKGVVQGPDVHPEGDVFVHTLSAVEVLREPTLELALATLLHDVGKPRTAVMRDGRWTFYGHAELGEKMAEQVCHRLRLSNYQTGRVTWLVRQHMRLISAGEMREARLKRLFAESGFLDLAELWRADCLASGGTAEGYDALMARYRALEAAGVSPPPLITGHDLIALGLEPGPVFRTILDEVYDAQLEGRARTREEALALARRIAAEQCKPQP
jgi:poly(A) polymerase